MKAEVFNLAYMVWALSGLVICCALFSMYLSVRRPGPWSMSVGTLALVLLATELLVLGDQPQWIALLLCAVACLGIFTAIAKSKIDALARARKLLGLGE